MMEIISVAVGGALGAVCRYLLGNFISRMSGSALPWGTFAINIIGCFCMGLLMTLIVERGLLPAASFALVAWSGNIYFGLWYAIGFTAVAAVAALIFLPETRGRDLDAIGA